MYSIFIGRIFLSLKNNENYGFPEKNFFMTKFFKPFQLGQ